MSQPSETPAAKPTPVADLKLSKAAEARIDDLQARYPTKKATLLPLLWEIQNETGWVSPSWMEYAAKRCDVPPSHVLSVVSFYTMFHRKPVGRHHVQVCRNISCHLMGAPQLIAAVEDKLGLKNGGVSEDGAFSLEHVECLAGCSWAPVMQIGRTMHENLTPEQAVRILEELE
ncbi:MAG: NAD(P)H-dependent oxidoreductase subunit E [Planctomycetes bacterium]|nr:NAD(P)H-dependent oxidoreductase subunit E [Planctomycetota bacterium]